MKWEEAIADAALADLPYKVEMNEWGKIEMSPASNLQSGLQTEILILLRSLLRTGKSYAEISIETSRNVKVADVIWASYEFLEEHGFETPYRVAPEICVEVVSPCNTEEEMMMKKDLYLAKGSKEVWFCSQTGGMRFFLMPVNSNTRISVLIFQKTFNLNSQIWTGLETSHWCRSFSRIDSSP